MSSTGVDRITGADPSVAIKAPCKVATTGPITLSGAQTVDGIAVTETTPKTRVLVRAQADSSFNGIYDVYDTAWRRSDDFNGSRDVVDSTLVSVDSGATYEGSVFRVQAINPVSVGVTSITFEITDNLIVIDNVRIVSTFAALSATLATVGQIVKIRCHTSGQLGGGDFIAVSGVVVSNGGTITPSATAGVYWKRLDQNVYVEDFGALGAPTDDTAAIQAAINAFPGGKKINLLGKTYNFSSTIYLKYQGIQLVGAGVFTTNLVWTAVGGTAIKANSTSAIINSAQIADMNIAGTSTTNSPDLVIDTSGFSYSTFENLETTSSRANAVLWKFYSDLGTAPYFNTIDNISMFGGGTPPYTQTGMLFTNGAWTGGSRGGNGNCISNIKRAAALSRFIDLKEGQGNMFSNIGGESISNDLIVLNDIASYETTGTATASTQSTLTNSGAAFPIGPGPDFYPAYTNYSVIITGGTGSGQCRMISTHTSTQLTISAPWGKKIDATSTYAIIRLGAFENMFTNVRQEGISGTSINCKAGAIGNKLNFASISGVTNNILDTSGDPSNRIANGDLVLLSAVVTNPGASANIDIWNKSSVLGGLGVGRSYSVEWLNVKTPGIVTGVATITLDAGGVAVGGGNPSLQVVMDSVIVTNGFTASTNKNPISSTNNSLFLNITTDAAMNAATDFTITVAVRIH